MDVEDDKKYNIFENILQKVNQKYIAMPDDETKRNNELLKIIDTIISRMREKNVLFKNLFQNKYYGGSYYDRLKVGKPSEYDLDCVLRLPKIAEPTVEVSDKPGYVYVVLKNMDALQKKVDEAPKYVDLDKLLDGNRLSTKKVKSWMESLMTSVWRDKINNVNLEKKKSGPALTINLTGVFAEKSFNIDVDVVPCFTFFEEQWPAGNYRSNPTRKGKNTFFVVPKSPNIEQVHYWRLSFQAQEKELISDYKVMKPTIKLIKKIRDRYEHKIASYFIKTVFLWELNKVDKSLWTKPLSFVFLTMLRKYADYVMNKSIPYYWNEEFNLIEDLSDSTTLCIANKIRNIIQEIDRDCLSQPYNIIQFFLSKSEVNIETFQKEVPLSKKFLKQIDVPRKSQELLSTQLSSTSSLNSSFEEINKVNETTNLEKLCTDIASEQKKITKLLKTVIEKIDNLEARVSELREEVDTKITEEMKEKNDLVKMVNMLSKKVDEIVNKKENDSDDGLFLPSMDMLKRTANFMKINEIVKIEAEGLDDDLVLPSTDMLKTEDFSTK